MCTSRVVYSFNIELIHFFLFKSNTEKSVSQEFWENKTPGTVHKPDDTTAKAVVPHRPNPRPERKTANCKSRELTEFLGTSK
jgi:hypothetical protein